MDKEILIIKNISREGPGILEHILKEKKIGYSIVDLARGEKFLLPAGFSAVVVLGGPESANDETDKILSELVFIENVLSMGMPFLGICLGLQLMVKAGGGNVVKNNVNETGFRDPGNDYYTVQLTGKGKEDPLFRNLGQEFRVFHLHGETVELKPDMTLLATGKYCRNQVVRIGQKAYGIQCHFELTLEMFEEWIITDPDLMKLQAENLRKDFRFIREEYTSTGKIILNNFLKIAGF